MRSKADRRAIGEYWLSRDHKSPFWSRTWFDAQAGQTRRASLGTTDEDEAFSRLAEWYVLNVRLRQEKPQSVPLSTILDRYIAEHAAGSPSEQQARIAVRYWKDYYGPELTVADLAIEAQEKFIASMRGRDLSEWYIGRTITVGKAALNRAKKRGELSDVPHVLMVAAGENRERVLTADEAVALWKAVDAEHMAMYLTLAFNTAARPDAILDMDGNSLDAARRLVYLNPPGRKQTKKHRPTIPMTNDLAASCAGLSGPLVSWRGKPLASIKTGWRALRRRAGVDAEIIPYTIRHTVASQMRAAGVPPWEVAGWLGHKIAELKTTERYAKFSPTYLSGAREAVDGYVAFLRASYVTPAKTA